MVRVDLSSDARPTDDELLGMMMGRGGKLRAPTLKVGTRLVVGYNQDMLATVFDTTTG